jgi:hypothetical protein
MVIQDAKTGHLLDDPFNNIPTITKVRDHDVAIFQSLRWGISMFNREKLGIGEAIPNSPGRPKTIRAVIVIKDTIRRLDFRTLVTAVHFFPSL